MAAAAISEIVPPPSLHSVWHLQVTVQPCPPLWIFRENFARLRQRQEFAAHRRTFERWRCIEPTVQTFGERGTDAG
jgi:hypothetical protein